MKQKLLKLLNNQYFEKFIITLIIVNFAVFIFDTDTNFHNKYSYYIKLLELFSVSVFTIEYLLRLCCLQTIKEVFKPLMIIDFLAIAPFYLTFVNVNTVFLRIVRLSRLLRASKLLRYTDAIQNIKNAFERKKNEIIVIVTVFFIAVTLFSILIYFAENSTGNATFSSIPSSFWWSIVTFTSVGYGDAFPTTTVGKIIGSIAAVLGVGMHGLLIGVLGAAFMDGINKGLSHKNNNTQDELVKIS